ncbi:histidine phosphotransferase ChpT [Caulobacter ginsengisoli]|uniref:Histidine phosphotransferase ChpT n=1 Tax=Caulobacter ginsengisoli TaxID=400775 RepID=A0ABU0ISB3_9CAUL|nr:histidine phosphotransferase family protein [Caulobacter ginsengisoli]MDQ0464902.1 histidine phosphotransferase ChpT [Caulobacter ginsengisoli]
MTQAAAAFDPSEPQQPAPPAPPTAVELGAMLSARLCHDFMSPASAIVSGLDLIDDPTTQDMREDAMRLIAQSAAKLTDLLQFNRIAFGASAAADTFDVRDLEKLTRGLFAHMRAELDWQVEPAGLNKPAARILLNLAQIGGEALPTGGTTRIRVVEAEGRYAISIDSKGPRARLRPEVLSGIAGGPRGEAMGGHWVQAYYLHLIAKAAGGQVAAESGEETVTLAAWAPVG